MRIALVAVAATLSLVPLASARPGAESPSAPSQQQPERTKTLVNTDKHGLGVQGYDVVAYFTEGKAVKGDVAHSVSHAGATYRFANAEHRRMFEADPERYVPAYGGYCAYGVSVNKVYPVDPEVWQIVDGRLMLQHDREVFKKFNEDAAGGAAKANANWPGLVRKHGK